MQNLSYSVLTQRLPPDGTSATTWILAAGTTAKNSGSIDTRGYNGFRIMVFVGLMVATGTLDLKLQGSNDDLGFVDIEGSAATQVLAASGVGDIVILEQVDLQYRYYRVVITPATANVTIDGVVAELFRPRVTTNVSGQHSTVSSVKIGVAKGAGTA